MAEEDEDVRVNPEMVRGYNDGYLLRKHEPEKVKELSERIDRNENLERSNYAIAFKAGVKHADEEEFVKKFTAKREKKRGR